MTTREEATAMAIIVTDEQFWDEDNPPRLTPTGSQKLARAGLADADAHDAAHGIHRLSLDDAAVERVRVELAKGAYQMYLGDLPYEAQARNVVAVLTEGAN